MDDGRPIVKRPAWPLTMGRIDCPVTSVTNYQSTLRNIPEERRSHLHRGENPKSRNMVHCYLI